MMESKVTAGKQRRMIPGKGRNLVFSVIYLLIIVVLPLSFLVYSTANVPWERVKEIVCTKRALEAFRVSFSLSMISAMVSLVLGVIVAWVLVKYEFPCRRVLDSLIDLPFAMPTAVSGIALASIYSDRGWIGSFLADFGIQGSYTPLGIVIALVFIGLPFVVRAMEPAIEALEAEMEEAAACLGASRGIILRKIVLPQLFPSVITGFTMSFARGLGEYGSVIFIAGNIPYFTEILPLLIVIKLEQFDYESATVLASAMLGASFVLLVILGSIGALLRRRFG